MSHFYNHDGLLVTPGTPGAWPSPTTILSIIDKPYIDEAVKRAAYLGELEQTLNKWDDKAFLGTCVHKAIEDLLAGRDISCTEEELPYIEGYLNWHTKYQPEVLETELFLESREHHYRGTCDLICHLDGELWIIDFKTGNDNPGHELQLKMYEQAYFEMTDQHARMGVLGLTPKNKQGYRKLKEYKGSLLDVVMHISVWQWWQERSKW